MPVNMATECHIAALEAQQKPSAKPSEKGELSFQKQKGTSTENLVKSNNITANSGNLTKQQQRSSETMTGIEIMDKMMRFYFVQTISRADRCTITSGSDFRRMPPRDREEHTLGDHNGNCVE
jgi:hypothetical protein